MPLQVQGLNPNSSPDDIKRAIAASIEQCINEGKPRSSCIAMVYRYAEKATGKPTSVLAGPGMEYHELGGV